MAQCCCCNKTLGLFANKIKLKNGYICSKCLEITGQSYLYNSEKYETNQVIQVINKSLEAKNKFHLTNDFGIIQLDIDSHYFKIYNKYYAFDDLLSFSYYEDPNNSQTIAKDNSSGGAAIGGVIGGLSGGLVGGAIGAAVGGKIGSFFSTTCNQMSINIVLKNTLDSDNNLYFITEKTKTASDSYKSAFRKAQKCIQGLQLIIEHNTPPKKSNPETQRTEKTIHLQNGHFTAEQLADELMIYKTLLYSGDITQEEYNEKKKQLLSLM